MPTVSVRRRVVEIEADFGDSVSPRWRYGSGLLIGRRRVLTAAHNVAGAVALAVRGPDKKRLAAELGGALIGDPGRLDLALLTVPEAEHLGDIPVATVNRELSTGDVVEGCWAVGYPDFAEVPGSGPGHMIRKTEQVRGFIPPLSGLGGADPQPDLLSLEVTATPRPLPATSLDRSEWAGMSGAAVFAGSYLIGVVTEHAPRRGDSSITVTPLDHLSRPALAPPDAGRWWSWLGADPESLHVLPPVRRRPEPAYRATVRAIRARSGILVGREKDLDRIAAFAVGNAPAFRPEVAAGGYFWLVGERGTGKTSLLAEVVHHLPADVDVVVFFLDARESRFSQQDFLDAVIPQLAFLLDEDTPEVSSRDTFLAVWERAADQAETRNRHLLLIVDGLEQENSSGNSVASVLPERLGSNSRVLVASRPLPGMPDRTALPADVPSRHPLITAAAHRVLLTRAAWADAADAPAGAPGPFGGLLEGLDVLPRDGRAGLERLLSLYVGLPGAPAAFGGRDDSLAALNRWLADPAAPYGLLVAPAGRGKSALLAQWCAQIAEDGVDVAFIPLSVRFHTASEANAITLLAARLRYLGGQGGPLPSTVVAWTDEIQAALAGDRADGRCLLIVLDGIDEAVGWNVQDTLLFPDNPGRGVKVLISARELVDRGTGDWRSMLNLGPPVHVTEIPLSPLDAEGVAAVFRSLGDSCAWLAERHDVIVQVLRLSEGDPLLVQLYAQSLRQSGPDRLDVSALPELPPGLMGFFEQWWRDQERQWGDDKPLREARVRALLALLANAIGPVTIDDVLAVAPGELGDSFAVNDAMEPIKRFVTGNGGEHGWIFSHPRLGYYFRDVLAKAESARWAARFVAYGAAACEELLAGRRAPGDMPAYIVRFHASHLLSQRAPVEQFDPLATPQWLQAWEVLEGGPDSFSAGLSTAQQRFAQVLRDGPGQAQRAAALSRQVRFALAGSALASLAGNVPPSLVRKLTAAGAWTQEHAVAYVRRMTEDSQRIQALCQLVQDLPALAGEALEIISAIMDPVERGRGIAAIVPGLPEHLHRRALEIIDGFPDDSGKGQALAALVPHLNDNHLARASTLADALPGPAAIATQLALAARAELPRQDHLLDKALDAARNIPEVLQRSLMLRTIAEAMPARRQAAAWSEFAACATRMPSASHRSWAFSFGPDQDIPPVVLAEFPVLLRGLADARDRSYALAPVAGRLPEAEIRDIMTDPAIMPEQADSVEILGALAGVRSPAILRDALALAWQYPEHYAFADTMGSLTGGLAAAGFADEALAQVIRLPAEKLLRAMSDLAPHLPAPLVDAAIEATRRPEPGGSEVYRSVALRKLARRLAEFGRPDDAVTVAGAIVTPGYRYEAFEACAPFLDGEALERATSAAMEPSGEQQRGWALGALAQRHLALGCPQRALDLVENISDLKRRVYTLSVISPDLPTGQLARAEAATQVLSDELEQAQALAALLPRIAAEHRAGPYAAALSMATAVPASHARFSVLEQLMPSAPTECVTATIGAADNVGEPFYQQAALITFLPRLVELGATGLALQVARRAGGVMELAGILSPAEREPLIDEAAAEARRGRFASERALDLAWLSLVADGARADDLLDEALDTVRELDSSAGITMSRITALLPPERRGSLTEDALAAVRRIPDVRQRINGLLRLASLASPEDGAKLGTEALSAAAQLSSESELGMELRQMGPDLPAASLDYALQLADGISDQLWAGTALAGLVPALAAAGRPEDALERALAPMPQGARDPLAQVGPYLPEPLLARALTAAGELEPYQRGRAYAGLAPRLAELGQPVQALELVSQIMDGESRAKALRLIAPALASLPAAELAASWSQALKMLSTGTRAELLADLGSLTEVIVALGGPEAALETAAALIAICTWIP